MSKNKGYTLIEVMVVTGLIGLLFSALLGILINSDTFWSKGQNKINAQQEARIAMDSIVKDLRESNTYWGVTITASQAIFYKPDFDPATGAFTGKHWIGYKLNPSNSRQLLRKQQGDSDYTPIANEIENLSFACSTDGCVTFNNNTCPANCPRVRVTVTTRKDSNFTLISDVVLRNQVTAAAGEPPEEGEF
jgi:prepilin-type N-terminal cleavage/methylation domain-containing protein